MAIRVVCEGMHEQSPGRLSLGQLNVSRDAKGHLRLEVGPPWRIVEIRRTGDEKDDSQLFVACSRQCEESIWAEMKVRGGLRSDA